MGNAFIGAVVGALVPFLVAQLGMAAYFDDPAAEATRRKMTVSEFEDWKEGRTRPAIMWYCGIGAVLGAAVGAASGAARRRGGRLQSRPRGEGRVPAAAVPLESLFTPDQLARMVSAALPFDVDGRSPEYVQGLMVGRLAEADPGLAHIVSRLRQSAVPQLLARLRDEQNRCSGATKPGR